MDMILATTVGNKLAVRRQRRHIFAAVHIHGLCCASFSLPSEAYLQVREELAKLSRTELSDQFRKWSGSYLCRSSVQVTQPMCKKQKKPHHPPL